MYLCLFIYSLLVDTFPCVDRKRRKEKEWDSVDNITHSLVYFEEGKAGFF